MAVIFVASATPGSQLPKFGAWDALVKKGGHVLGYGLLAVAYVHALNHGRSIPRAKFIVAVCLAALYAATDEFHQRFTPGRTSSLRDVGIDVAGACIGLALWRLIRMRLWNPHKDAG
jgi:VanZ family protein